MRQDPVVATYPVFLIGLPIAVFAPAYLLLLGIPAWRARRTHPATVVFEHLVFGAGALRVRNPVVTPPIRLMVYPRDRNPYQRLLYEALDHLGVEHRYIGDLTESHTVNLLLLIPEIAFLRGERLSTSPSALGFPVHVARKAPSSVPLSRLMRWYLVALLETCRILDVDVIWTAHNVLPHDPVFDDDAQARRQLTARCRAVIVHNAHTLEALGALGCRLPAVAVIPSGPPDALTNRPRQTDEQHDGPLRVVFIGKISRYKGIEDLLDALSRSSNDLSVSVVIGGECSDLALFERLTDQATRSRVNLDLRLRYLGQKGTRVDARSGPTSPVLLLPSGDE